MNLATAGRPAAGLAEKAVVTAAPSGTATERPAAPIATGASRSRRGTSRRRRRMVVRVLIAGGVAAAAAGAAVVVPGMLRHPGPVHTISVPGKLLNYSLEPTLAKEMGAQALRADIVKKGNGEASHVVDAVYEDNSGAGTKAGPLIILFIGGNLSGSADSFISSFTGMLPGAVVIKPGSLGGEAACVPGSAGHPSECAWADNDTFGLFASPTLSASALGAELRAMRPLVEHRGK